MPLRRRTLLSAPALMWAGTARASAPPRVPPELASLWPAARLHGEGRLRFIGLHVYDARLWTPEAAFGRDDWPRRDFALELQYARAFAARQIAERSLEEMRRGAAVAADDAARWLEAMTGLFADVRAGDRMTGLNARGQSARFFLNGQWRGEMRDAEFTRRFFGIWLAPQTSQPQLRAALLGLG